jgi:hypothetical protein
LPNTSYNKAIAIIAKNEFVAFLQDPPFLFIADAGHDFVFTKLNPIFASALKSSRQVLVSTPAGQKIRLLTP